VEEGEAEFLFQDTELLGDRRLGDELGLGRSRDRTKADDGAEIAKVMQFDIYALGLSIRCFLYLRRQSFGRIRFLLPWSDANVCCGLQHEGDA
jgi:hypothetical protein